MQKTMGNFRCSAVNMLGEITDLRACHSGTTYNSYTGILERRWPVNQREAIGWTSRSSTLVAPDRDMKQAVRQVQYDLSGTYFVCLNLYDVYSIRVNYIVTEPRLYLSHSLSLSHIYNIYYVIMCLCTVACKVPLNYPKLWLL